MHVLLFSLLAHSSTLQQRVLCILLATMDAHSQSVGSLNVYTRTNVAHCTLGVVQAILPYC
jgi:hypothetical protein